MEEENKQEEQMSVPEKGNTMLWIVVIAIIVLAAVFVFSKRGTKDDTSNLAPKPNMNSNEAVPTNDQNVKTFDVSAKPFEFSVKEIRVKNGDKVRINFTSSQGTHDWVLDEFSARTKVLQAGQSESVEFVADKTGTFEYYCSVPTHRQQGMVGKLIVE